jgi:Icc-related predicted phosphoesterase
MVETNREGVVTIAAVSDVHYGKGSQGSLQPLFSEIAKRADILVICGDLTDYGLPEEAELLIKDLNATIKIPTVASLGNHDFESGKHLEICDMFSDAGVTMLDGESCEIMGIGFAGVKGFCGGFGRGALGYWGEPAIKAFVQETLDEALKLESALARLRTDHKIAVLHYAPIQGTIEGEPPTIFPYLGSGRLEEPLNRYPVDVVFHGHAHNGTPEGATTSGIPVYNVSRSLLEKAYPDRPAYREYKVQLAPVQETMAVD